MPWKLMPNYAQVLAVHAAYMGFGQILYFGGDEHDPVHNEKHAFDATCLFDCGSNAVKRIKSPHFDAFCAGHAFLGASNIVRLLVAGGTEQFDDHAEGLHNAHFPGLKDAAVFSSPDFISPAAGGWDWLSAADMTPGLLASPADVPNPDPHRTGGRWYPTLMTLANGNVIAFSGHPGSSDGSNSPTADHNNCIPEIFEREPQPRGQWRRLANYANPADRTYYENHATTFYPRMHLLPTGDILCTNPVRERTISFTPDAGPQGGTFHDVCAFPPSAAGAFSGYSTTSVLLPLRHGNGFKARAMICGGASDSPYLLDLARWNPWGPPLPKSQQLRWTKTGPRRLRKRRLHACAVILPTGQILVCGGIDAGQQERPADSKAVLMPELYDPYTDTWDVTGEAASSPRNYHSVALLMPDGRVWTAGSDRDAGRGAGPLPAGKPPPTGYLQDVRNLDIEIYAPWYVGDPGRPYVTAAPSLAYPGETVLVRSTHAREIDRVVLLRCGSCTHAFDSDQRLLELAFKRTGGDDLQVTMPPDNNIMPPGPYLIFTIRQKPGTLGLPSFGTDIYIVQERHRR